MAQQTINVGTAPNDGTGTPLRTAFQYTNSNFSELYTAVGPSGNNIVVPGSATITGDLTVDTSTLKVDSANNRVGIGTASPAVDLHIQAAGSASAEVRLASATRSYNIGSTGSGYGSANNLIIYDLTGAAERYRLDASGNHFWNNVGGVAGTAMTLNSTGLGVGGSPSYKLSSIGTTNNQVVLHVGNTAGTVDGDTTNVVRFAAGSGANALWANARYDGFSHAWRCNSTTTEAMVLNSSGNVGIGVTPSAGKGCLQLSSGINFPATQVASSDANTLDDYVETTFSPTIVGSTVAGTATYTTQIGRATKIGRLVTFSIRVAYSAGTGIGNLRVGNLPFAAGAGSVFAVYAENIALTAGNYPVCGISSGNTFISIDQLPTGGGAATAVPYDAAGDIQISGSYIV